MNLGAPVGKSVKVVAFCLQLGQQGVHSFLLAPYKFVKALGYGCYFFLILRHDLLHLAEGFFERISAIHILIPFAVYQEMIEFFSLFVGLEYLVKRFKVFVIYEYFSKIKIKFFIMIFPVYVIISVFISRAEIYFYEKGASFYIMRLLFTYYNICLPDDNFIFLHFIFQTRNQVLQDKHGSREGFATVEMNCNLRLLVNL